MLQRDMRDLMGEYAGELRFALQALQQAVRDDNHPARHGEGIDRVHVDDAERPRQVGAIAVHGYPAPNAIHVALQAFILVKRRSAKQARGNALAKLDLFFLRVFLVRLGNLFYVIDDLAGIEVLEEVTELRVGRRAQQGCGRQQNDSRPHAHPATGRLPTHPR